MHRIQTIIGVTIFAFTFIIYSHSCKVYTISIDYDMITFKPKSSYTIEISLFISNIYNKLSTTNFLEINISTTVSLGQFYLSINQCTDVNNHIDTIL